MQFLLEIGPRYVFIRLPGWEAFVGRGVTGRWTRPWRWEWSVDRVR